MKIKMDYKLKKKNQKVSNVNNENSSNNDLNKNSFILSKRKSSKYFFKIKNI